MASAGKYPGLAKHVQLGDLLASNRVFMASLTRNRSVPTTIPNDDNVLYYQQRAKSGGAGLIFSEGILISPQGTEWPNAPGIWDDEQAQGWKKVVDAVHAEGTPMVAQLWHVGRVAHPDMEEQKKAGLPVYGPSAVAARGGKFRQLEGQPGYITPTPVPDPTLFLDQYSKAAKMAKTAGFDGVELHSANGYLVEQFLSDVSNVRDDQWGGSIENRCRLGLESVKRLIEVYGANRVGIKLSPCGGYNDQYFTSTKSLLDTFRYYIAELDKLGLAYIQITQYNAYGDSKHGGKPQGYDHDVVSTYGDLVKQSKLIVNCGYDAEKGEQAIDRSKVEAVVYGQAFISNPDYFHRLEEKLPLHEADPTTFYSFKDGPPGKGYNDYPFAEEEA